MYSWDNPDDRLSIAQMNSELQHAQLELLSAHCATHQLRLRFSTEDLARFGQRDILRKSVQSAAALSEFYSSIEKKIPAIEAGPDGCAPGHRRADRRSREAGFRVLQGAARALSCLRGAAQQSRESADVAVFFRRSA